MGVPHEHFIFRLCNMKKLHFRHLTLTVKIINSKFFLERSKNGSKKATIICDPPHMMTGSLILVL